VIVLIQFKNEYLTVFQSSLYQTTSTVVQTKDLIVVVDPTWLPHEITEIREHVESIKGDRPIYLLFTHADFDHIIGYMAFPEAKTIGSIGMKEHPEKEYVLDQIAEFDSKYYVQRDYPIHYPDLDIVIKHDGESITIGETTLSFYKAPGHTPDGLFTVIDSLGLFIAGDYLSNVEFPYIYHSSLAYEETMNRVERILKQYDIRYLIPGHGQITNDTQEMRSRMGKSLSYIRALRDAIIKDDQHKVDAMVHEYPFPKSMKSFHVHNQSLIKEELKAENIRD
jgi:hydroxyacylglutathione hydrolase